MPRTATAASFRRNVPASDGAAVRNAARISSNCRVRCSSALPSAVANRSPAGKASRCASTTRAAAGRRRSRSGPDPTHRCRMSSNCVTSAEGSPTRPPSATAARRYVLNVISRLERANITDVRPARKRIFEVIPPWSTGGGSLNIINGEDGSKQVSSAYDVKDYQRLTELKAAYDPANILPTQSQHPTSRLRKASGRIAARKRLASTGRGDSSSSDSPANLPSSGLGRVRVVGTRPRFRLERRLRPRRRPDLAADTACRCVHQSRVTVGRPCRLIGFAEFNAMSGVDGQSLSTRSVGRRRTLRHRDCCWLPCGRRPATHGAAENSPLQPPSLRGQGWLGWSASGVWDVANPPARVRLVAERIGLGGRLDPRVAGRTCSVDGGPRAIPLHRCAGTSPSR
jgi:hypothetical protein